jgi:hypothetical protein
MSQPLLKTAFCAVMGYLALHGEDPCCLDRLKSTWEVFSAGLSTSPPPDMDKLVRLISASPLFPKAPLFAALFHVFGLYPAALSEKQIGSIAGSEPYTNHVITRLTASGDVTVAASLIYGLCALRVWSDTSENACDAVWSLLSEPREREATIKWLLRYLPTESPVLPIVTATRQSSKIPDHDTFSTVWRGLVDGSSINPPILTDLMIDHPHYALVFHRGAGGLPDGLVTNLLTSDMPEGDLLYILWCMHQSSDHPSSDHPLPVPATPQPREDSPEVPLVRRPRARRPTTAPKAAPYPTPRPSAPTPPSTPPNRPTDILDSVLISFVRGEHVLDFLRRCITDGKMLRCKGQHIKSKQVLAPALCKFLRPAVTIDAVTANCAIQRFKQHHKRDPVGCKEQIFLWAASGEEGGSIVDVLAAMRKAKEFRVEDWRWMD